MRLLSSSYGAALAHLQAIQKETRLHNDTPFITCEGKCCEGGPKFTEHRLLSELYDKDDESYTQIYACNACHGERVFGYTTERVTSKGPCN